MRSPPPCPRRWTSSSGAARPPESICSASASRGRKQSSSRRRSSSRRSSRRAWPSWRRSGRAASSRTSSSATRWASSPHLPRRGRSGSRRRWCSCASAASRWPKPRARTRAPWRRSSVSTTRWWSGSAAGSSTCGPRTTTAPGQIVVSGENPAVDEACAAAEQEGARRAIKLRVSGAFHSPLVARAADRLRPALDRVKFAEPTSPFMSTVTARVESAKRMGPLLVEQLTAPVRFTQATQALMMEGVHTFVEVGPGNVLAGLVKRIDRNVKTDLRLDARGDRQARGDALLWLTRSRRSRGRPPSSPAARVGSGVRSRSSWRARARTSRSATALARTRPSRWRARREPAPSRRTSPTPSRRRHWSTPSASWTSSSTTQA